MSLLQSLRPDKRAQIAMTREVAKEKLMEIMDAFQSGEDASIFLMAATATEEDETRR